jgi:FHA domain
VTRLQGAFYLWIDGIGGYLVCLDNQIKLGQATPQGTADVQLVADVSREHALVTRDPEGYLLQALRPTRVNGKMKEKALLRNGDRLTLGKSCQLQFQQPVPISTSARLEPVSGHRLRLAVDAVLLMADTLVLGPGQQVHVHMPDLKKPLILFRQMNGLGIRTEESLTIDGKSVSGRGALGLQAQVAGEEFSFALEAVGGGGVT